MAGHPALDQNAAKFYQASLAATQEVAKSGVLDAEVSKLTSPGFTSLSQIMQVWAARYNVSVVMPLSPIREDLAWLATLSGNSDKGRLAALFCPESPWGIERFGDRIYVVRNRLAFLDRAWRLPMEGLLSAEKAMGENGLREPWRARGGKLLYVPERVEYAFLDGLSIDDQLAPLGMLPADLKFRGLPVQTLVDGVVASAVWRYRPAPTVRSESTLATLDPTSVPVEIWTRLQLGLYPGRTSLRLSDNEWRGPAAIARAVYNQFTLGRSLDGLGPVTAAEIFVKGPVGDLGLRRGTTLSNL
jgi:hypothetical protein